jgi:hypothetical protein
MARKQHSKTKSVPIRVAALPAAGIPSTARILGVGSDPLGTWRYVCVFSVLCCFADAQALRQADPPSKETYQTSKTFTHSEINFELEQVMRKAS